VRKFVVWPLDICYFFPSPSAVLCAIINF